MAAGAKIEGSLAVAQSTVFAILDDEARAATSRATKVGAVAINAAAPRGPTGRLARAHRASVSRSGHGYAGKIRRAGEAWYGIVVEKGRHAGVARTGRRYPAARANPFVDRATAAVEAQVERILVEGGERAATRIQERV
jgi:hypothetical protein